MAGQYGYVPLGQQLVIIVVITTSCNRPVVIPVQLVIVVEKLFIKL